jgi:Zn finger protein HypA/HybF involved in hydrogenase expression
MSQETDESLEREKHEESNSLGNCQKCGFKLEVHDYIGLFCPMCTYLSIEISFGDLV